MIVQTTNFGPSNTIRFGINKNHTFGEHIHYFSEIVLVLEGSIVSTVNGKDEIARKGDIIFITPLMPHGTISTEYSKIFTCVMSNDFLTDFISQDELLKGYDRSVFTPSSVLREYIWEKFIYAAHTFGFKGSDKGYRTFRACVHSIIDEFTQIAQPCKNPRISTVLADVILYVGNHYNEPITQSGVSKKLGYSSSHISHVLQLLPNINFTSLLNAIRVEHAKELLLKKQLSNIEIAYECGFSCERTFYRAFSKIVNMTPSEYVKSKSEFSKYRY